MKVSILGSTATTGQIVNLRAGFASLGHEHVDDPLDQDVAFVFVGNPPYDQWLDIARDKKKPIIFNLLDHCWHCAEIDQIVESHRQKLPLASKVTAISKTCAASILEMEGVAAETIYYPMNPVKPTGVRAYPQFRVMMAGRLRDPNKFTGVAVQALVKAGFSESEVAIVGPERIGWGTYMGEVSTEVLNDLYNSVDYVMCMTRNTGLELTIVEGAAVGAIPIVLPHLETFNEFWRESPLGLHYSLLTSTDKIANLILSIEKDSQWKADIKKDVLAYANREFVPKMSAAAVAQRIIEVYQSV